MAKSLPQIWNVAEIRGVLRRLWLLATAKGGVKASFEVSCPAERASPHVCLCKTEMYAYLSCVVHTYL